MFCTHVNLEHLWCLPFGAKVIHTITWRMNFLTWTKPGDNLEFYDLNKLGTLYHVDCMSVCEQFGTCCINLANKMLNIFTQQALTGQ